jgi:hypothetical protein
MAEREWLGDVVCFIERAEVTSPMIAEVEAAWTRVRGKRAFPARRDVDPPVFKAWLPYLSLVDVGGDPFRVHYRLIGTEVARFAGEDFGNHVLEDTGWKPEIIAVNRALYRRLWDSRAPVFGLSKVEWYDGETYSFEWGLFPLSEDGRAVDCCLSVDDFTPIAGRTYLLR